MSEITQLPSVAERQDNRRFALIGAAGYIAPRHMRAIAETGNELVAAVDPHDSVGVLDSYFPNAKFFTEIERFDRFLEKLRLQDPNRKVDYISVCSPNYLHDAHVRLGLRVRANVICEKPMVISPWNIAALQELEHEYGVKVFPVLQLRLLPSLIKLRKELLQSKTSARRVVRLSYVTRRGSWYHTSWKGQPDKSGGLAMNIGIHFFDLLLWLFGPCDSSELHINEPSRMSGRLVLHKADVQWFLSVEPNDLPKQVRQESGYAFRSVQMDGNELEFSTGFEHLHTEVYREVLAGRGFSLQDAKPSIDLVHQIRGQQLTPQDVELMHPFIRGLT